MTKRWKFLVAFVAIGSLLGCASDPKTEVINNACKFNRDRPSTLTSYVNNKGGIVYGDVKAVADLSPKAVYVAVAGTTKDFVKSRSRRNACYTCGYTSYGPACGWVPCNTYSEEDARGVYGLARATSIDEAKDMAAGNCEKIAEQFAKQNDIPQYRIDCKIIYTTACF